jgi:hypothetical protein
MDINIACSAQQSTSACLGSSCACAANTYWPTVHHYVVCSLVRSMLCHAAAVPLAEFISQLWLVLWLRTQLLQPHSLTKQFH